MVLRSTKDTRIKYCIIAQYLIFRLHFLNQECTQGAAVLGGAMLKFAETRAPGTGTLQRPGGVACRTLLVILNKMVPFSLR